MTLDELQKFFGWCALLNAGVLTFSTIMIVLCRSWVARFHGRLFGLDESTLSRIYMQYLAQYKILTLVFFCVPWLALKIME